MPRPAVVGLAVAGSAVVLVGLLLVALFAGSKQKQRDIKTTRAYYLSVDEVKWDYAPAPDNACQGRPFDDREAIYARSGPGRIGSVYKKAVFRGYADGTFTKSLTHPPHLGIVGPPVHVEVGDTFKVVLRNNAKFGGVNFAPDNVSPVEGFANPEEVASGDTAIFAFQVSPESGPSDGANASSVMHFYSSSVDRASALYAGLLGPLIVTRKGEADADGRPTDVDDELVTVLFISDENASPYMDTDNKFEAGDGGGDVPSDVVEQSNQMHSVNGMVFCNLPGLDMKMGKRTRWYGAAIGNEADLHTLHWHGNVGSSSDGLHTDSVRLLSHSVYPIDFAPQNPGRWLGHCHVGAHLEHAGMLFLYNVAGESAAPSQSLTKPPTRVREYFIQAEDTVWDYAPQGSNVCDKKPFGFQESIFVEQDYPIMGELESDEGRVIGYGVGSSYVKSHYVQYTDDTFSTAVERTDAEAHLGLMGPVLRVRVGEAIKVHFRNNCSDVITMHTHGLFYLKDSEGAPYVHALRGAGPATFPLPHIR
jgi:manganese oxidase